MAWWDARDDIADVMTSGVINEYYMLKRRVGENGVELILDGITARIGCFAT